MLVKGHHQFVTADGKMNMFFVLVLFLKIKMIVGNRNQKSKYVYHHGERDEITSKYVDSKLYLKTAEYDPIRLVASETHCVCLSFYL